jgi:hypothetical protein
MDEERKETEMEGREYWRIALVALLAAAAGVTAPATARSVVDYARNADKVDGRHAVGARVSVAERRNKLVATNKKGYLPNNIIRKAPNASRLGGRPSSSYLTSCDEGVVVAAGTVSEEVDATYTAVDGYQYVRALGSCEIQSFDAKRVGPGIYQVRFVNGITCAGEQSPSSRYTTVVTVKSPLPLFASSETVCDADGRIVEEVRVFDADGAPEDAAFTIALMTHVAALP